MLLDPSVAEPLPSSFRDPAGFVFNHAGAVKRAVTPLGAGAFEQYCSSGLHGRLTSQGLILDFQREAPTSGLHAVLAPEQIPFISYPYEWSFDQLRDAALLTLRIQEEALACGLSLKDASAFNVQFRGAQPFFIDHTSFEPDDGGPWIAYEQFCRHFLGPLLLMQLRDPAWNRYLRADLDGPPLPLVSSLLPRRTWFQPDTLINIHLHARAHADAGSAPLSAKPRRPGLKRSLAASLRSAIERLQAPSHRGVWTAYESSRAHYSVPALETKLAVVNHTLARARPSLVFDLGANSGIYSGEAAQAGAYTIALDSDPACVNQHYRTQKAVGGRSILPLLMSLENPSPGSGFALTERASLVQRGPADFALVLALIHHLRLTARTPFTRIAAFLASLTSQALVEFVPLSDPMACKLLAGRTSGFEDYTLSGFQRAFARHFRMAHLADLPGTQRSLWILQRNGAAS